MIVDKHKTLSTACKIDFQQYLESAKGEIDQELDRLDVLGIQESLGKTVGKDGRQHKTTYPALHGIEASQRMASQLVREACEVLEPYGDRTQILQGIARYLLVRQN